MSYNEKLSGVLYPQVRFFILSAPLRIAEAYRPQSVDCFGTPSRDSEESCFVSVRAIYDSQVRFLPDEGMDRDFS